MARKSLSGRGFIAFMVVALAASLVSGVGPATAQEAPTCDGLTATIFGTDGDDTLVGTWRDDIIWAGAGDDTITGASGNDVICGGDGDDTIGGGSGEDRIFGGPGNDTITGDSQADTIHGGDGDDTINGGSDNDVLDGGNGFDTVDGSWQTDVCDDAETALSCETETFNGEPDNPDGTTEPAPFTCNGLNATIVGTDGDDTIQGTWQADVIVSLGGDDVINAGSGEDTICAGDGNDIVNGQSQADWIDAGPGDDTVTGADGNDTILGGPGADDLSGGSQADIIHGGDGDDQINGGAGPDTLDGGNGTDTVDGSWQQDTCDDAETAISCETVTNNGEPDDPDPEPEDLVFCFDEVATIVGTEGDDLLLGTDGPDVIWAGAGVDTVDALGGDDLICTGSGSKSVNAGPGDDVISIRADASVVDAGPGDDTVLMDTGTHTVFGGSGDDEIVGTDGVHDLQGGDGADRISITGGSGVLSGDDGDDSLIAPPQPGAVNLSMDGGEGIDFCETAAIVVECEVDWQFSYEPPVVSYTPQIPAGQVVVDGPQGMDPGLTVLVDHSGGFEQRDLTISSNFEAAQTLGEALVSPVYEFTLTNATVEVSQAQITIPYRADRVRGDDVAQFSMVWLDTDAGRWRRVPGDQQLDPVAGTITATTPHFSSYAIIRYSSILELIEEQAQIGRLDEVIAAQNGSCDVSEPYLDAVQGASPVHHWRFSEGNPLADSIGDADLGGGSLLPADSQLPGTNDGATALDAQTTLSDLLEGDGFTLETWVPWIFIPRTLLRISRLDDGPGGPATIPVPILEIEGINDSPGITVRSDPSNARISDFGNFGLGLRHSHVVLSVSGDGQNELYVDGVARGSLPVADIEGLRSGRTRLEVQSEQPRFGPAETHEEMLIYRYPLTENTALAHFAAGLTTGSPTATVDADADLLPDCEEIAGLFTLTQLSQVGEPAYAARLDPDDPDVDNDFVVDGQELVAEDITTTDLVTDPERTRLLALGLRTVYRARSFPWLEDSDGDGASDLAEFGQDGLALEPGTLLGRGVYPPATIVQPVLFGGEPAFESEFKRLPQIIKNDDGTDSFQSSFYETVVSFNTDYQCVQNCQPLDEYVRGRRFGEEPEGISDIPCTWNQIGDEVDNCSNAEDLIEEWIRYYINQQDIFQIASDPNFGVEVTGAVISAYVVQNCFNYATDCTTNAAFAAQVSPSVIPELLAAGGATIAPPRPGATVQIPRETIVDRTAPRITNPETGRPFSARRLSTRRLIATVGATGALIGSTVNPITNPSEQETEELRRTRRCEDIVNLDNQQPIFDNAQLPTYFAGTSQNSEATVFTRCNGGIPIYFPGNDVPQATAHRITAITTHGQPALLSERSRAVAVAEMKAQAPGFNEQWFRAQPFDCEQFGLSCDEYPNLASQESGPFMHLGTQRISNNFRTASLCLMGPDNRNEGINYGAFKGRSGLRGATGRGRYFLVIPDPAAATDERRVRETAENPQPRRTVWGSYAPPQGITAEDQGGC